MRIAFILSPIFVFISITISAQDTITIYYDKEWVEIENRNHASFYRKAFKTQENIWMANDFYISGKIQMECPYKSGKFKKQHGKATFYYENGQVDSKGEFYNNLQHGEWMEWYETGEMKTTGNYEMGERSGLWNGWYKNGQKKYSFEYIEGKKAGTWEFYYETGELEEKNKSINSSTYLCQGFYKNGAMEYEGEIENGTKNGIWTYWNDEGEIKKKGFYLNGLKQGNWMRYFKEESIEILYINGEMQGQQFGGMIRK